VGEEEAGEGGVNHMEDRCEDAKITIVRGKTDPEIYNLALATYGGNHRGEPKGEFMWSNRTARNCIRHNLTNYEQLWSLINRGETAARAYEILRERVNDLIDEAYPQYAAD
jgi:hypothetical protein